MKLTAFISRVAILLVSNPMVAVFGAVNGYASYKAGNAVTTHEAWGIGVYCVFHAAPVVAENAVETPAVPGVKMHHLVTIRLGGRPGSGINHVINGTGASVISIRRATMN